MLLNARTAFVNLRQSIMSGSPLYICTNDFDPKELQSSHASLVEPMRCGIAKEGSDHSAVDQPFGPNMSRRSATTSLIMYNQGVTKRCRRSWLTNSALVHEPKWGCGGGGLRGLSQ
jgi:hypothetical protein